MRIGIDARFLASPKRRGIGNYSYDLILSLTSMYPDDEFFLFYDRGFIPDDLKCKSNVTCQRFAIWNYFLWEQVLMPFVAVIFRLDVMHWVGNTGPIIWPKRVRYVLTLHDIMFLYEDERFPPPTRLYQRLGRFYRKVVVPISTDVADAVITVSGHSKDEISRVLRKQPEYIFVTGQSCSSDFRGVDHVNTCKTERFILALAASDPRKNTIGLLKAYNYLVKQHKIPFDLILVGLESDHSSSISRFIHEQGLSEKIILRGYISNQELRGLYQNAELFVFPSYYEGFGIPILEAFWSNCPVAVSDASSFPEVAGNAAVYFDPNSYSDIAYKILAIIEDPAVGDSLKKAALLQREKFSWDSVAATTYQIYASIEGKIG